MSFTATDYPSGALTGSGTHNVTLSGSAVPDGMLLFASLGGTADHFLIVCFKLRERSSEVHFLY
ncbi:hypothetical protein KFZ60_11710 [Escherichia coli]|nr:hypothetical protein [Escherichia coli]WEN26038.1 hypothetical protein KFZ60_11710 [Escherichia coli]SVF53646.1 Uncharacterised protein [Escherichia coli]